MSNRKITGIMVSIMISLLLAALDSTIVATAMPTVIGDLHGIDHYAWVFTAYLLAEIASIPLWGRLADMYGRKRIFLLGMVIFLVGSVFCGLSTSMAQLIIFRAVQGVGAGCLLPVAQTIVADLYTLEREPFLLALTGHAAEIKATDEPVEGGRFGEGGPDGAAGAIGGFGARRADHGRSHRSRGLRHGVLDRRIAGGGGRDLGGY